MLSGTLSLVNPDLEIFAIHQTLKIFISELLAIWVKVTNHVSFNN